MCWGIRDKDDSSKRGCTLLVCSPFCQEQFETFVMEEKLLLDEFIKRRFYILSYSRDKEGETK